MTRKKGQVGGKQGKEETELTSPPPGTASSSFRQEMESEDTTHHPEDEYIVPQIVKVVSLADAARHSNYYTNGGGVRGVLSSNNVVLVDNGNTGAPSVPPPSFMDNGSSAFSPPEESILGLAYGDEEEDDGLDDQLNHKFASFTLSTPLGRPDTHGYQPDDRVDYFSTSGRNNSSSKFTPLAPLKSNSVARTKSQTSSSSSYSRSGGDEEFEDWVTCPPAIPCTSFLEEMNFCQGPDCSTPANKKCGQCKNAFYCCEDHHRLDWGRHSAACTPYRITVIGTDELPILAAVASRNIPAGTVIFTEKPMLVFPLADSQTESQFSSPLDLPCVRAAMTQDNCATGPRKNDLLSSCCSPTNPEPLFPSCLGCGKVGDEPFSWTDSSSKRGRSVICSKCGLSLCSYNCQFLIAHQAGECDAISSSKLSPSPSTWSSCVHSFYMDVEIMRALQLEKYDRAGWELFLGMRNSVRVEDYKKTARFQEFLSSMEHLVPFSVKISGYNSELIGDVHAIINSLSYRPNLNCPFKLLFNTQPSFAHDCVPNTLQYVEEEHSGDGDTKRMRLVAKAALPLLKGDVITLDFTPSPYLSYQRRRLVLNQVLNIRSCMCQRCQHPSVMNDLTAEIKCYSCQSGTVFSENFPLWKESVWSCRICQEEISFYRIQDIERQCEDELGQLVASAGTTGLVRELQEWIRRRGSYALNPKHQLIFMAWCYCESIVRSRVAQARRPDPAHVYSPEEMEHFELLGKYADTVLEHMDSIRPGIWLDKGMVQFHKFYSSYASVCRSYQHGTLAPKEFINNVMKSLKILQQSLQTLSVYEGYNAPSVLHLTHEATSVLASVKEYMSHFLQLTDHNSNPLPPMADVLNKAHL